MHNILKLNIVSNFVFTKKFIVWLILIFHDEQSRLEENISYLNMSLIIVKNSHSQPKLDYTNLRCTTIFLVNIYLKI